MSRGGWHVAHEFWPAKAKAALLTRGMTPASRGSEVGLFSRLQPYLPALVFATCTAGLILAALFLLSLDASDVRQNRLRTGSDRVAAFYQSRLPPCVGISGRTRSESPAFASASTPDDDARVAPVLAELCSQPPLQTRQTLGDVCVSSIGAYPADASYRCTVYRLQPRSAAIRRAVQPRPCSSIIAATSAGKRCPWGGSADWLMPHSLLQRDLLYQPPQRDNATSSDLLSKRSSFRTSRLRTSNQ